MKSALASQWAVNACGSTVRLRMVGNDFPPLTNHCSDILVRAAQYLPPMPVGPVLFERCPHPPTGFQLGSHLPFVTSQSVLWGLARLVKPRTYLEIGTLYGSSCLAVTKGSEGSVERVVSIDLNPMTQRMAEENLRASGYRGECRFLVGNSRTVKVEGGFDLVFVDGDHTFEGVKADVQKFWHHVNPGGYMGLDDTINKILPKVTRTSYTWARADEVTDFAVLEATLHLVSRNKLFGLDSVVYQYPSWSGFGLMHKRISSPSVR